MYINSIFLFLKKNWLICLLVMGSIYHFMQMKNVEELMRVSDDSYKSQISSLKEFHSKEIMNREKIIKDYENKILNIDRKYNFLKMELQKEREKNISLFQRENPEQISKRIKDAYGFNRLQ